MYTRTRLYFSDTRNVIFSFLFPHGPSAICRTGCDSVRRDRLLPVHPLTSLPFPHVKCFVPAPFIILYHVRCPLAQQTPAPHIQLRFRSPNLPLPIVTRPGRRPQPIHASPTTTTKPPQPQTRPSLPGEAPPQPALEFVQAPVFPSQEEHGQRRRLGERPRLEQDVDFGSLDEHQL